MRRIYIDESGTSEREPVAVVAGVIIDADKQWREADRRLALLREELGLPRDFVFHAKDIFANKKGVEAFGWDIHKRIQIIGAVITIATELNVPQAYGWFHKRDAGPRYGKGDAHWLAFTFCLWAADQYVRAMHPDEVATVIAEDSPDMRKRLKKVPAMLRDPELREKTVLTPIGNIVDSIHFAEKDEATLLQIADCCAFAMRRYISSQRHGSRLYYYLARSFALDPIYWKDRGGFTVVNEPGAAWRGGLPKD